MHVTGKLKGAYIFKIDIIYHVLKKEKGSQILLEDFKNPRYSKSQTYSTHKVI